MTEKFAHCLFQYLAPDGINDEGIISAFQEAILKLSINMDKEDDRLVRRIEKYPFLLPLVDAGLALNPKRSKGGLRQLIFVMACIIEANSKYANRYMPKKLGISDFIKLGFAGARSISFGIIGVVVLKFL